MFTIYYSDVTGVPSNCSYPHKKLVTDEGSNAAKSGFGYFEDDDDMEE